MKISDINYATLDELKDMPRFDLKSMPKKAKWYLQVLAWILAIPETLLTKMTIHKHGMKPLKNKGYLLLCNHNSFFDFKMATRAVFPRSANYIVAIDGFINREKIMRNVGCIGKRKFVPDPSLIKQIDYSVNTLNSICMLYPEARYSLVGTTAILPESLGKMIKRYRFPVATLIAHGHHLHQPVWNLRKHRVKVKAEMTYLFSPEEIDEYSVQEINERIKTAFYYNDYEYQVSENIKIKDRYRAENLHKVLYKCPHCLSEKHMTSKETLLICENCHTTYQVDETNRLHNMNGESIFTMIPDWFEWERSQVKEEVENQTYETITQVYIDALPNSTGFYRLGKGKLIHNHKGFYLEAKIGEKNFTLKKPVLTKYGVHIEYEYFGKGDCVSLSTHQDTYYLFPVNQDVPITKYHFAAEELYKFEEKKKHVRQTSKTHTKDKEASDKE
jgi:transcription elongation factor Elf1